MAKDFETLLPTNVLETARVARLATVGGKIPHLVPVVFVHLDGVIWMPVDDKPKKHLQLKRLKNIRHNPQVSLLIDHYEDSWQTLWWVRIDAQATLVNNNATAIRALAAKYAPYKYVPIHSLIRADINNISHWQAS